MTNKAKIITGVGIGLGLIVTHALFKAKLNKPKTEGRSNYGWKVYNLINHGKFKTLSEMEVQNININKK